MKYYVKASGDKEYCIELVENLDGSYTIKHEEENVLVDVHELKQGHLYSILLGQRSHDVLFDRKDDQLQVSMEGRHFNFEVQNEMSKTLEKAVGPRAKKKGPPIVKAEMPGVVLEIKVSAGDKVEEGDVLMVVEAMKMQNEILAPAAAEIIKLCVDAKAMISDGDELIHMKYS